MRKWIVIAATLACASAGLVAAAWPDRDGQASTTEPRTETRTKTVVVSPDGEQVIDEGPGDVFFRTSDDGVRIGLTVANLDDEQAKSATGAVVTGVREDSPAAKAGLKEKDVITEFAGEKVRSARQLSRLVSETPPGRSVSVAALRDGKRVELQITPEVAEHRMTAMLPRHGEVAPWDFDRMPRMHPPDLGPGERRFYFNLPEGERFQFHGPEGGGDVFSTGVPPPRGRLGVGVQDLSGQLAEYFGTKDGVLVSSVSQDSPAAKAGLRAGDVITSVNDTPVTSTEALLSALRKTSDGGAVKLGYVRDKKPATATATLDPREKPTQQKKDM
jgi:serine protease Do